MKINIKELFQKEKFLLEWHAVNGMLEFVLNIKSFDEILQFSESSFVAA